MRRPPVLAFLSAVLLALTSGCEADPDQRYLFGAGVVDSAGAPLSDRTLVLARSVAEGCDDLPHFDVPGDGGFVDVDGLGFTEIARQQSGADGRVLFELLGSQVSPHFKEVHARYDLDDLPPCFSVRALAGEGETSSSIRLHHPQVEVDLPPVVLGPPSASFSSSALGVEVSLPSVPVLPGVTVFPDAPEVPLQFVHLRLTTGDELLWTEQPGDGGTVLRPELFEDRQARTTVELDGYGTRSQLTGLPNDPTTPFYWFIPELTAGSSDAVVTSGPPASRGRPCEVSGAALQPCPFTDGLFRSVWLPPSPSGSGEQTAPDALAVDLGAPLQLRWVVIRGLELNGYANRPGIVVEGAAGPEGPWTEVLGIDAQPQDFPFASGAWRQGPQGDGAPASRWVRLRVLDADAADAPLGLLALVELSIFG